MQVINTVWTCSRGCCQWLLLSVWWLPLYQLLTHCAAGKVPQQLFTHQLQVTLAYLSHLESMAATYIMKNGNEYWKCCNSKHCKRTFSHFYLNCHIWLFFVFWTIIYVLILYIFFQVLGLWDSMKGWILNPSHPFCWHWKKRLAMASVYVDRTFWYKLPVFAPCSYCVML